MGGGGGGEAGGGEAGGGITQALRLIGFRLPLTGTPPSQGPALRCMAGIRRGNSSVPLSSLEHGTAPTVQLPTNATKLTSGGHMAARSRAN
eukprot:728602-Prymnesium_polylepis.1